MNKSTKRVCKVLLSISALLLSTTILYGSFVLMMKLIAFNM